MCSFKFTSCKFNGLTNIRYVIRIHAFNYGIETSHRNLFSISLSFSTENFSKTTYPILHLITFFPVRRVKGYTRLVAKQQCL